LLYYCGGITPLSIFFIVVIWGNIGKISLSQNICSTVNLSAAEDTSMVPISSPLTPPTGENLKTSNKDGTVKPSRVQAVKKDIRMVNWFINFFF
jgi:hypothetical protein